jgi:hypothetical protein
MFEDNKTLKLFKIGKIKCLKFKLMTASKLLKKMKSMKNKKITRHNVKKKSTQMKNSKNT